MTQYNTLNVKFPNLQLNKLKSRIKNSTEVTLKVSSNVVGNSTDETNLPHKLLSRNTRVSRRCKDFANGSSVNMKLSKTQLPEIGQSGGFLGRRLAPLLKADLPLIKNALKPLAKSVIPLGLTTVASATDPAIQKKICWIRYDNIKKMNDIMEIAKSLQESGLLMKPFSKTINPSCTGLFWSCVARRGDTLCPPFLNSGRVEL